MWHIRIRRVLAATAALVLALAPLVADAPAHAAVAHTRLASTDPANWTPHAVDDATQPNAAVHTFAQVGSTMFAGGDVHLVQNAARTVNYIRSGLFSFSATTGVVTSFAPTINGGVWALATDNVSLWVGGTFSTVNGVGRRGVVKIRLSTGAVETAFDARLNGDVTDLQLVGGRLIAAGRFAKRLVALHPVTGADTGYINLSITGTVASNAGPTAVYRFAISPDGRRLVGIGNFTSVGGFARSRAFMIYLSPTVSVAAWYYAPLRLPCSSVRTVDYLRDVDFSPGGSYFVMVAAGAYTRPGELGLTVCDAAARFETNITTPTRPTWMNYTGGDTLHSVAVTGVTVYVGGHQRWMNNAAGRSVCAPGCVSRPGVASLDPVSGLATAWNPTRTRGVGVKAIYTTAAGVWFGSDTRVFGGEIHDSIAFSPLP